MMWELLQIKILQISLEMWELILVENFSSFFLRRTHVKLFSFLTHLLKNRCRFYVTDFGSKAMNRFLSFYNVLIFKIASIF
ncbi:hypothetical protein LICSK_09690 [Leptospira interrogans serovar Copenhageni]|nr:hypothetical protein LICSK_09690 [Leptospira interrogans serovar Copenhageni]